MKTATQLIDEARARVQEVSAEKAMQLISEGALPIDCREPNEWNLGHLPGALHIPRGILETTIEGAVPHVRPIVLYCASGTRSALAADTLQQMGYSDVFSLAGGFRAWAEAGGDIDD
jgi:phage shock protein E